MIPANHLHPERSTDMRNVTPPARPSGVPLRG